MNQFILRLKHWQIFAVVFGAPALIYAFMMVRVFAQVFSEEIPDPTLMFDNMKYFGVFMFLAIGGLLAWFWSIGTELQHYIPEEFRLKTGFFKIAVLVPAVYFIGFTFLWTNMMTGMMDHGAPPNVELFFAIIPLHFFSMFCIFYNLYFVARTVKTVELQRKVSFGDYIGEFFLFWFHPIGVWFLQPKLNKLIEEE